MNLAGKNIVITGAASGIGRAMTRRFKAEGAGNIVITDVNAEGLAAVAEETGAIARAANLGEEQAVLDFIGFAETELGQIDLLCNNAGISVSGGPEVETSDWQAIWNINVMAHVWATRAALPAMLSRGEGYLLHTASAAGLLSQIGSAPYAVTKHAAVAYAEWLAITYGDQGLNVSALCPQAVCVRPRMRRYAEVSAQVFAIFNDYTPLVEGLSLDEAYLDVTASISLKGDPVSIARDISPKLPSAYFRKVSFCLYIGKGWLILEIEVAQ